MARKSRGRPAKRVKLSSPTQTQTRDASPIEDSDTESTPLFKLPAELRNRIYKLVADECDVQTLNITKTGLVTFPHPLFWTCRELRTKFQAYVRKNPQETVVHYVAQVKDFNFAKLRTEMSRNPNLKSEKLPNLSMKVHHHVTTVNIDYPALSKWMNFLAKHGTKISPGVHEVRAAPLPDSRMKLVRNIEELDLGPKTPEVSRIQQGFFSWWKKGAAKYDFLSDEELQELGLTQMHTAGFHNETQHSVGVDEEEDDEEKYGPAELDDLNIDSDDQFGAVYERESSSDSDSESD